MNRRDISQLQLILAWDNNEVKVIKVIPLFGNVDMVRSRTRGAEIEW